MLLAAWPTVASRSLSWSESWSVGECSYWGCIPSKTLIRPGDVLAAARRVPGAAEALTARVDAPAAFAQRDYMTSSWSDAGQVSWLDSGDIQPVRGPGRLAGPREVRA